MAQGTFRGPALLLTNTNSRLGRGMARGDLPQDARRQLRLRADAAERDGAEHARIVQVALGRRRRHRPVGIADVVDRCDLKISINIYEHL